MIFRTVTLSQFEKSAEISTIFVRKKGRKAGRKRLIQGVGIKMKGEDREEQKWRVGGWENGKIERKMEGGRKRKGERQRRRKWGERERK